MNRYSPDESDIKTDKKLGYQYFMNKQHPMSSKTGRVYMHRHVASVSIGRPLLSSEHVHHIDGNKTNNLECNLEIVTNKEHARKHYAEPVISKCNICGENFKKRKVSSKYCSEKCYRKSTLKIEWPECSILLDMKDMYGYSKTGRILNVSDNAVKKHILSKCGKL